MLYEPVQKTRIVLLLFLAIALGISPIPSNQTAIAHTTRKTRSPVYVFVL
jgi:hypothetical protein